MVNKKSYRNRKNWDSCFYRIWQKKAWKTFLPIETRKWNSCFYRKSWTIGKRVLGQELQHRDFRAVQENRLYGFNISYLYRKIWTARTVASIGISGRVPLNSTKSERKTESTMGKKKSPFK
jgi:hypothetical protein